MSEITDKKQQGISRRDFFKGCAVVGAGVSVGLTLHEVLFWENKTSTFIGSVNGYSSNLRDYIVRGLREIGITERDIKGKKVLLKPNMVEPHKRASHINTDPAIIRAAAESFLNLGASGVLVAEGAGHRRDAFHVLEESGLAEILYEDRIPFVDLNTSAVLRVKNAGKSSKLKELYFPSDLFSADVVVSMPKMKTHHWAGVTLSMKNLFGVMPGIVYGWPKNVLHWAGLQGCIFDITATLKPHLAIVDGIVGMEGDGPIMGTPIQSNVIVIGKNLPAVDATCARIMGIDPEKISYLKHSSGRIGAIKESNIDQRGENIQSARKNYQLLDYIPAHAEIRLKS
jgi:uncharacterized protein (DUF362 family)